MNLLTNSLLTDPLPFSDVELPAYVLGGHPFAAIQQRLSVDFSAMAEELSKHDEIALCARIKAYDHGDRLTFGRAITSKLCGKKVAEGKIAPEEFKPVRCGDPSVFPRSINSVTYPGVWGAAITSLMLLSRDIPENEEVIISIYCHRVLVRPGAAYQGFCHRDNQPGERCGTMVWYPRVDVGKIIGASLFCRWGDPIQATSSSELRLSPADYRNRALIMRYPYNLVHGVDSGRHTVASTSPQSSSAYDFVRPDASHFIKDLFIVTVSERENAEE